MKYYQEISLLPDADIGVYFLWQKLYQQIHLALVENKIAENASAIGVGFPEYDAGKFSMGTKLRLFAEEEKDLAQINCEYRLKRLDDYTHIRSIRAVPDKISGYVCFRHIKLKGNKEKLARRRAKRKGETLQQALAYFASYEEERSRLPYINMNSQTTGNRFRLFIEKKAMEEPQIGPFSCYGLSKITTVPCF